jgi:hypothetical protein
MQRDNGTVWIHSFAHGRTVYELKHDAAAVEAALNKTAVGEVASVFVRMALTADLGADELDRLCDLAGERAKIGKRAISEKLKAARQERERHGASEEQDRRAASKPTLGYGFRCRRPTRPG